jgi:predicted dehydrogenase
MAPGDIRVGLIGFGLGGAVFHAPLVASTPGMRLAAIVTSSPERAHAAAETYPGARVLPSAPALFATAADLDLAVITTPNETHAALAHGALDAGLPVVVDKPMAATAVECRRLVEHARRARLMLTVFHNRRWDGDFLTIQDLLADGALGRVHRMESRFERWRPVPKPGWRQQAAPEAAGGLLYDLGSHLIDQARILFGPVTEVYAELDRRAAGSDVDDDVFVALTHGSGVRSHLWMSAMAAQHGPRFRLLGDRAAYTKSGLDVQEAALRDGGRPDRPDWGVEPPDAWGRLGGETGAQSIRTRPGAYAQFYLGVVAALRQGAPPPVDPADGVAVVDLIEHARRAASERRVVPVSPAI